MKMSLDKIDGVIIVFAQLELTMLSDHYPREVDLEREHIEAFRDLLKNLSSEPQDDYVSAMLNRIVSEYLDVPLYERWRNVAMEMESIAQVLDRISTGDMAGESYPKILVRLIEFCNIFYKKLDREQHRVRSFNPELVPA